MLSPTRNHRGRFALALLLAAGTAGLGGCASSTVTTRSSASDNERSRGEREEPTTTAEPTKNTSSRALVAETFRNNFVQDDPRGAERYANDDWMTHDGMTPSS